jgi:hypothetical protein
MKRLSSTGKFMIDLVNDKTIIFKKKTAFLLLPLIATEVKAVTKHYVII